MSLKSTERFETVWHACTPAQHIECSRGLGQLAAVSFTKPDLMDLPIGAFLMELHPPTELVKEGEDGRLGVWLPAATSYPHSVTKFDS